MERVNEKTYHRISTTDFSSTGYRRHLDFTWDSTTGDLDHIVMYHKDMTGFTGTAQEFIDAGGFTEITLGNTSPQEFTVDYARWHRLWCVLRCI
jgi:hypothetical protein